MNIRMFLFGLFLISTFFSIQAQRTTFLKSFGRTNFQTVLPTPDNGCVVTSNGHFIKLNHEGFIEWQSVNNVPSGKNQIIRLSNGNYIVGGTSYYKKYELITFNANGELLNTFLYESDENKFGFQSFVVSNDSNLTILETEQDSLYLRKIMFNGTVIWRKPLHLHFGSASNYTAHVIQLTDSSYIISRVNKLIKTDRNGKVVWIRGNKWIYSIYSVKGGFLLSELNSSIFKYNFDGSIIWENPNFLNQIFSSTFDGNIISLGYNTLTKLDSLGNAIWHKSIPQVSISHFTSQVFQATDGGYFMFVNDIDLLKTDADGEYSVLALSAKPPVNQFEAFGVANITWQHHNLSENSIDLSYSTNLGNTWNNIVQSFPADSAAYTWHIPEINSEEVYIKITDSNNPNIYDRVDPAITILVNQAYDTIAVNNVMMWFGNNGDGSNNPINGHGGFLWPGGMTATKSAIFEDGILFGGKINGEIIVNGSTYRHGFLPGIILENGLPDDSHKSEYKIFKSVKGWESLPPGIEHDRLKYDYNHWPVNLGAPFKDINRDGIYTPGIDKPYVGDETFFYVNNSADSALSTFVYGSPPVPLEFQTTIWGYNQEGLKDVVFKKYKIINKGDVPITDMYLSYWTDDDLGGSGDDYSGVDTLLNMAYTYNGKENDYVYGSPPPAVAHMMIQGPKVPASENDSAWFNNDWHKGFKNIPLSAFVTYFPVYTPGDPPLGMITTALNMYSNMQGLTKNGEPFVNPNTGDTTKFMLAGDPVTGIGWYAGDGWINGPHPDDIRYLESSGTFTLAAGDTQEVAYAIFMAKGSDRLNSITKLREEARFIQNFYNSGSIQSTTEDNIIPDNVMLMQNYPNPFNPSTIIRYSVPTVKDGNIMTVKLKIYDVLGREITTLLNKKQAPGNYNIIFNGTQLASGVYFYRLTIDNVSRVKKMVLLR